MVVCGVPGPTQHPEAPGAKTMVSLATEPSGPSALSQAFLRSEVPTHHSPVSLCAQSSPPNPAPEPQADLHRWGGGGIPSAWP